VTNDIFMGQIDDGIFGTQTFDAFFSPGLGAISPSFYDFDNMEFATVDSVVLIVNVDTTLYFGDRDATHNVDVFLLEQEPDLEGEYYSNEDFPTQPMAIASGQEFKLQFEPYQFVFNDDTTQTSPSVRLKLDNSLGEAIIMDTASAKNDTLLRDILVPGFKIVNRPDKTGVISLDLSTKTLLDRGNKLYVFYTDTISKFYAFPLGGVRHLYNEKDSEGSDLAAAITEPTIGDSLLYIQGYGGADIKLEFPTARFEALGDILLKKAEIEITTSDLPGDDEDDNPMRIIYIDSEDPADGERERIVDLINASAAQALESGFGGRVQEERDENDELVRRFYTFNATAYFQQLLKEGSDETGVLYLEAASPELILGRSVINGPGHSTNPLRLKLTYSIPN